VLFAAGCDRPTAPVTPPPASPTPAPTVTATEPPAEAGTTVTAEKEVKMDPADEEIRLVKSEVLSRIDVMPDLSDEEKDKLYVQVERARGMGKLLAIPFASGQQALSANQIQSIKEKLALPQFASFQEDPTVVFVVLGFADKAGDPAKNLQLSRARARGVADALKDKCGLMNVTHSVGMGSSEMFDAANLDKNRIVEIWAVLP
jgi:outer membrane protein OmpA-like peptidoglycan-associated protein